MAVTPVACPNSAMPRSNHASRKRRGENHSTANNVQARPNTDIISSGFQFAATTESWIVATAATAR